MDFTKRMISGLAALVLAYGVVSFGAPTVNAQETEMYGEQDASITTTVTADDDAVVQETINVAALEPFSPEANYMSLPGYYRYLTYIDTGVWLSYGEAQVALAQNPIIELETAVR
ncbi:MAG: hypothetical protein HY319_30410 [Armatimonadetes bacterium]|nr:hypothetical protein [Armatimonadota bacterium]